MISINKHTGAVQKQESIDNDSLLGLVLPRRVKRSCPATIFAISQIARVPGIIIFLVISKRTVSDIMRFWSPVPDGTRWAKIGLTLCHLCVVNLYI